MAAPLRNYGIRKIFNIYFQTKQPKSASLLRQSPRVAYHTRQHGILRTSLSFHQPCRWLRGTVGKVAVQQLGPHQVRTVSQLGGPLAFTALVGVGSFAACSIWQYESVRSVVGNSKKGTKGYVKSKKSGDFRNQLNALWAQLNGGTRLVAAIIGVNVVVFVAWRVPALAAVMERYFTCTPCVGAPLVSMVLSAFSHKNALHLFCNMYVLWSFAPLVLRRLEKEHFLAVYLTAGAVSGFTSTMYKVARCSAVGSLGASGAILTVLGICCTHNPDARLGILGLSSLFTFSAEQAKWGVIAFDTLGCIFQWMLFDHAAHLGGMLFGVWYAKYGERALFRHRMRLVNRWHRFRGPP